MKHIMVEWTEMGMGQMRYDLKWMPSGHLAQLKVEIEFEQQERQTLMMKYKDLADDYVAQRIKADAAIVKSYMRGIREFQRLQQLRTGQSDSVDPYPDSL